MKARGKPDAANPHVRFDVAGVGNVARLGTVLTRAGAPILDPTGEGLRETDG